jgi:hypothetical protein
MPYSALISERAATFDYDESASRDRGLRSRAPINITGEDSGMLVRPEVARQQIDQERLYRVKPSWPKRLRDVIARSVKKRMYWSRPNPERAGGSGGSAVYE